MRIEPSRPPSGRLTRLRGGLGLVLVALVLAVHPAAGAGEGSARGLAVLLRELLCGCASCSGDAEVGSVESGSCCGHEVAPPDGSQDGCEQGGACTCSHPDRVPVQEDGPLASGSSAGTSGDLLARAHAGADIAGRTPSIEGSSVLIRCAEPLAPPGSTELVARGAVRHASRPVGAPATGDRLALLDALLL